MASPPAGYSGTPLVKKLGLKSGQRLLILNAPDGYCDTLGPLPAPVELAATLEGPLDFIHYFAAGEAELEAEFPRLALALALDGALWVSWPKRASKVQTDLRENVVREIGLRAGLVDVKVVAVDGT